MVAEPVAKAVVVRQRSVVHEAEIVAGVEGMSALGRDRAFRRHTGVADGVAAGDLRHAEPRQHVGRQPDFLVDLEAVARAHDPQFGPVGLDPAPQRRGVDGGAQNGMAGNPLHRDGHAQVPFDLRGDAVPIEVGIGIVERDLSFPGLRVAVDRDTGAVRPPLRHL